MTMIVALSNIGPMVPGCEGAIGRESSQIRPLPDRVNNLTCSPRGLVRRSAEGSSPRAWCNSASFSRLIDQLAISNAGATSSRLMASFVEGHVVGGDAVDVHGQERCLAHGRRGSARRNPSRSAADGRAPYTARRA